MTVSLVIQRYSQSRAYTRQQWTTLENLLTDLLESINGNVAPADAQYLTLATDAMLSNERTLGLTAGHLTGADGGAGAAYTLSLATTAVTAGSYGGAGAAASLTIDAYGRATAASTVTLVQDAINDSVTTIAPSQNAVYDALALKQPLDSTLTAIAALDGTAGLLTQTGVDTFVRRALAAPAAGLTITNPAGTAGDPTFGLANDLAAVEGLSGTGIARRTGTDAWSVGTTVSVAEGGTGATTLTGYVKGSGISAFTASATVPWSDVSSTPTTLSGYGITDAQPLDATLTALSGANWAANALPIGSGADTLSQVSFAANTFPARASAGNLVAKSITDFGLSLVDDADASAARTTLGLVIGTNVQAYDAELAAIAGLTSAADRVPYFTGSGTAALANFTAGGRALIDSAGTADTFPYFSASNTVTLGSITAAGRALLDDAAASNQRTTLGLGTAATQNTGTSGANVPLMSTANTWSDNQTIDSNVVQVGKASSGLGGSMRIKDDGGTVRWLVGLLGTASARDLVLYDISNSWAAISINATTGVATANKGLAITEGAIVSGTYTPTLTGVANVDSTTARVCQYMRVGAVVTVSGSMAVNATASAATRVGISLPISSALANARECVGPTMSSTAAPGYVIGDATNDRAEANYLAGGFVSDEEIYFHFTYRVI